jgi:four helix bundle protein
VRHIRSGKLSGSVPGKIKSRVVAKMGIVVEEADEAILWLELMTESGIVSMKKTESLLKEAHELTAIFAASQRTARNAA